MTKPYSLAFKEKMLERLTGKDAVSAIQLGREMGVPQQTCLTGCKMLVAFRWWPRST